MEIKVLGPGCKKCTKTEKLVKEAVAEEGIDASVEKVTDMMQIAAFGAAATPAVVLDGEMRCSGKVPKKAEIKAWLTA